MEVPDPEPMWPQMKTAPEPEPDYYHRMAGVQGETSGIVYPQTIGLKGHVYTVDGVYHATDEMFNGYPVYRKDPPDQYSVYYRTDNMWVADADEVDDTFEGTRAYWHGGLFRYSSVITGD